MAFVNCHQDGNCTFGDQVWFSTAGRKRVAQVVLGNLSNAVRIYQSLVSETNIEVKKGGPEILILVGGGGVFIVQFSCRVFFPSLLSLYGIIIKNLSFILKCMKKTLFPPPSIFEEFQKSAQELLLLLLWLNELNNWTKGYRLFSLLHHILSSSSSSLKIKFN